MNINTGEIVTFDNQIQPPPNYIPLGNYPHSDCKICAGTGVKEIRPSGRRIPCKCTNPQTE